MANNLVKLEPIQLPDPRRPTQMPSLPAWLAARKGALAVNLQQVEGRYQDVQTLPAQMMLSDDQRTAIQSHLASLGLLLRQTPAESVDFERATFAAVTKLLLVKPAAKTSEAAAEARIDAYMAALDDVASWAIEAAIRKWYRGECGKDERGKPYDYNWAPEPHALRRIALSEMFIVKQRMDSLEPLLAAIPFVDTTEDLKRGRSAWRGLMQGMAGRADLSGMTFDDAVAIGEQLPDPESESSAVSREAGEAA